MDPLVENAKYGAFPKPINKNPRGSPAICLHKPSSSNTLKETKG